MILIDHELGLQIESDEFVGFFGGKGASVTHFLKQSPWIRYSKLKQVHGKEVVEITENDIPLEGDAQFTNIENVALCISTADCAPVLFFNSNPKWIAAAHVGWRGVAQNIVGETLHKLFLQGCTPETIQVLVGPHIQEKSFEVEDRVRDQILAGIKKPGKDLHSLSSKGKSFVDLSQCIKQQLTEKEITNEHIFLQLIDTYKSQKHHSFRRDKVPKNNQLSYIMLKPTETKS